MRTASPRSKIIETPPARRIHHARSPSRRNAEGQPTQQQIGLRRGQGPVDRRAAVRPHLDHQRGARSRSISGAACPNPDQWQVTPETARLLQHWRHHQFSDVRPFFCQVEAVETAIWLTEVAPHIGKRGNSFLDHLASANNDANPELMRSP